MKSSKKMLLATMLLEMLQAVNALQPELEEEAGEAEAPELQQFNAQALMRKLLVLAGS